MIGTNNSYYKNIVNENLAKFGISPSQKIQYKDVISQGDPFEVVRLLNDGVLTMDTFNDFLNKVLKHEIILRNSSTYNQVRTNLLDFPGVPTLNIGEPDIRVKNGTIIESKRVKAPIASIIWFTAAMIAYDQEARDVFLETSTDSSKIPLLLNEFLLRVRSSICGNFSITPKLVISEAAEIGLQELKGSFFDINFIRSKQGMLALLSYYSLISATEGYSAFVDASASRKVLFFSGFQTTQCSITVDSTNRNGIRVLQGTSFAGGSPSEVHAFDAVVLQTMLNDGQEFDVNSYSLSPTLMFDGISLISISHYIVYRALSITRNSLNIEEEVNNTKLNSKAVKGANTGAKQSDILSLNNGYMASEKMLLRLLSKKLNKNFLINLRNLVSVFNIHEDVGKPVTA